MPSIIVTGDAGGAIDDRVVVELHRAGLAVGRDGRADTVVSLGGPGSARHALELADGAGATSIVHLSSGIVYGAWRDNPVPLTEEAALRPNPGIVDAVRHAEDERTLALWAEERGDAHVAVLRAATVVGSGIGAWTGAHSRWRPSAAPARQFVHVDDIAGAVRVAVERELDGVYNVAPDGAVPGDVVRELSAGRVSAPVPDRLTSTVASVAWAAHLSDVSPDLLPLVEHPWVIANDKLRAEGWVPQYTNEEAVVAGRPGSWWREMSPGRRQQLTLAASTGTIAAVAGGVAAVVLRRRRRR